MISRFQAAAKPLPLLFAVLLVAGCDKIPLTFEDSQRELQKAEEADRGGHYKEAVPLYEAALDGTPKTAEVHYKIALIYEDKLKDPIGARHHFSRYLALAPNGDYAKDATRLLKECDFKLSSQFTSGPSIPQEEAARLKNENLKLTKRIAELDTQLRMVRSAPAAKGAGGSAAAAREVEMQQKPIPPGARTYVVQSGDTLASIARKFYKSPARWKDIQDANYYSLTGTPKLKPGQTLIIPE